MPNKGATALPDPQGPWSFPPDPPAESPPPRPPLRINRGFAIWLGLVAIAAATYVGLTLAFPGQLNSLDQTSALQALGFLALVSSGLVFARSVRLGVAARNAAIWIGVAAIAILGYSFRAELAGVFERVRGELIPAYAVAETPRSMTVTASSDGGFYILGKINGAPVRFAIDTGANGILLSPADAQRAGIDVSGLKFAAPAETANGVGYMAAATAGTFDVGVLRLTNVPLAVNQAPMSASLLGMAFLRRMDDVEIHGDQMTLRWKAQTAPANVPST
ncbi:MAG TPA: TIGR02281 family clan AA aspartic protease [Caulobacteraceae bacterium]|nr:TIGR02281 family clan AA aspartic protease [Caulobacteraceae bacterium]